MGGSCVSSGQRCVDSGLVQDVGDKVSGLSNWRDAGPLSSLVSKYLGQVDMLW